MNVNTKDLRPKASTARYLVLRTLPTLSSPYMLPVEVALEERKYFDRLHMLGLAFLIRNRES
jgi:hypothetical protein